MAYRVVIANLWKADSHMSLYPQLGVEIDEIDAKNLQLSYILNAPGSVGFQLALRDPKCTRSLLEPGQREIHVYDNQQLVFGADLWTAQATMDNPAVVVFNGEGFLTRLSHRYLDQDKDYSTTVQEDAVWDLITTTQAEGDVGIVRGNLAQSATMHPVNYQAYERKVILEAIQDFSALDDGFDFELTADRTWHTYYPTRGVNGWIVFELGKNVTGLSWNLDATGVANEVTGIGSDTNSDTILSVQTDADSKLAFGLMQTSTSHTDVSTQAALDAATIADVAQMKSVRDDPETVVLDKDPAWGEYAVGDTVHLKAESGYVDIDQDYRILSLVMQVTDEGRRVITATFDTVLA